MSFSFYLTAVCGDVSRSVPAAETYAEFSDVLFAPVASDG